MWRFIKNLFKIENNFLEEFLTKFIFLFLIIFGVALTFLVFDKYYIFLDFLLLPSVLLLIGFIFLFVFLNKNKIEFRRNKINYLIIGLVLFFCIFNSFYFSESKIEGGHDQGGYLESGILLAKTNSLYIDPTEKPFGYAIPGWSLYPNGELRHHFPPGNAIFLSMFYKLFNFKGIEFSNSFLLFFSVLIIYFLIKKMKNWKAGLLWLFFFLFNFYTIYFSRATYVENLQLLFVWFYIYLFIKGYLEKDFKNIVYAFFPLSLLTTVRLEAILYIIVYFFVVFCFLFKFKKDFKINPKYLKCLIVLLLSILIISDIFIFDPSIFTKITESIKSARPGTKLAWGPPEKIPYNQQIFVWVTLFYMFTPIFFLISFLGILNFFKEGKETKKTLLLIAILIIPQFAFLTRPGIAFYLPWAMRRFWAVFIPFVLLLFSLFLSNYRNAFAETSKKIFLVSVGLIFLIISIPGFSILSLKEGNGILQFEQRVASYFKPDDLVIFWDRYKYENWGPPLYFLYDTNVVFDRSPAFDRQIYALIMKEYKNVYIATSQKPNQALGHPYFSGQARHIITITSPHFRPLGNSCDVRRYLVHPETFRGYYQIRELCEKNNPPADIRDYKIELNIYKLNEKFKKEFVKLNYDPNYKINRKTKNLWH